MFVNKELLLLYFVNNFYILIEATFLKSYNSIKILLLLYYYTYTKVFFLFYAR